MGPQSAELFERALIVAPGGVHSPVRSFKNVGGHPVFFETANGAYMTSVEGDEYIDFCQSFGPLILGHRDPDVTEAVHKQLERAWTFGACEPYSLELAEWMVKRIPHLEKVRFVNSGTEAVMSAIRVARAATGRALVLKFEGCYHGHADSLLVKAGSGLAGVAASSSAGVPDQIAKSTVVCPLDDIEAFKKVLAEHGPDIALVAVEPLPANYGLLIQKPEFLEEVARLTKENGSLLLFDEVISGFRVALGGMAEKLSITPDLVCFGKIIGGGFPVGAYGGRRDLMDLVAPSGPVYQAGTLSANPVGMRAGLATLKKIEKEQLLYKIEQRAQVFYQELSDLLRQHGKGMKLVSYGSLFWIHTSTTDEPRALTDLPADHGQRFSPFFHALLEEKVYFAPNGYEVGFLSAAHTPEILDEALERIKRALKRLA